MQQAAVGSRQCEVGKKLPLFLVSCFLFFVFSNTVSAQALTDSTGVNKDSTTINFERQANANKLAVGMDTMPVLPVVTDTSKKKVIQPFGIHTKSKHRFYWNASRYNTDDSSLAGKKLRRHSPLYAVLFSVALPGLGQAYNKKYWKIPIVYAGFGGLGYACYYTGTNYTGYRNAYRAQVATVPDYNASYNGVSDVATLKTYRDYFKKNLDISAICTAVWYALNLVDAAVDAHLFEWNMKDDIHLSWQPVMINNPNYASTAPGLSLNLNF